LNEIQQHLVYPDDVSWLDHKIHAIKKNVQTLSVTSGQDSEENIRLSRFENRVLREISGARRAEVTGESCVMRSFMICASYHIFG
jgi:hypothetical protein